MKKILCYLAIAVMAIGCGSGSGQDLQQEKAELRQKLAAIFNNESLSDDEATLLAGDLLSEAYDRHHNDSLGLYAFKKLLTNCWSAEKSLAEYEKAGSLIRNDKLIVTKVESLRNAENVLPGKPYLEISGPNAISGETLCIGDILAQGKPVLVDFWASWCGPCRNEIKTHLLDLYAAGKVNIIGIAVWEQSVDNTRKAMDDLGISWPVIYTGGPDDSPTTKYGVVGIPALFLLAPDGTIIGSGSSVEEIDYAW